MTTKNEGRHPGEFLVSEANGTRSREQAVVTVPASTVLQPGTVLGLKAADGEYAPFDDGNSDGTETAVAVLYGEARNDAETPADLAATIVRRDAEVRAADLIWGEGVDEDAGAADLIAVGIIPR